MSSCNESIEVNTQEKELKTRSATISFANIWQQNLEDKESVSNIFLPGTHDTGAYRKGGALVRTQKISIKKQLEAGVRALDIRLRAVSNSNMEIYHGIAAQGLYFQEDILRNCISFLKKYPSEFLIMSIKKEGDDINSTKGYKNLLYQILNNREFKPYLKTEFRKDIKVSDLRGKILLLHRTDIGEDIIGGYFKGWQDDASFRAKIITKAQHKNATLYVEDDYKVPTLFSIDEKWNMIKQNLLLSSDKGDKDSWFITFASGTGAGAYPNAVAKRINPKVRDFLKYNQSKFKGILFLDFVKESDIAIKQIIKNNFN